MRNAIFRGNGWALRGLTRLDHQNRFESGLERSLAANQCRSNRIVSTTTMEFHDAFHDLKCESCAYLSFFFLFSFYFVCLFGCSFLVFFSFFRWKFPFCISYKRGSYLMPIALCINWYYDFITRIKGSVDTFVEYFDFAK